MNLRLQDPAWPESSYLLEEILDACQHADHGGGTFSFASPGGVRLLLHDQVFESFLQKSPFELVVGVDAVTNVQALERLQAKMEVQPNLSARAFLDSSSNSLFHPKMSWFKSAVDATWIIGSGNLTPGGLRGNLEAFTVIKVTLAEHVALETKWRAWLEFHADHLFPLDNNEVVDQAKQNTGREMPERKNKGLIQEILAEEPDGKVTVAALNTPGAAVLIAEIPRASTRWNQANFSSTTFQHFFGATPGRTQRVLLTHVSSDGSLGNEELRPSVSVASHNYRFELEAAAGLLYPIVGRPIGIFLRAATRTFRYHLLMPGSPGYDQVSNYLQAHVVVTGTRMRRHEIDALALAALWPECPVLLP